MAVRQAITVTGVVQGVGFRPFVCDLAGRFGLRGFVQNQAGGVRIEIEGEADALDRFLTELTAHPPPLAQIDRVDRVSCAPRGEAGFGILPSAADADNPIFIGPDVATCADCLAELFNPADRRYRYPFLNCTNCGPRLTIIRAAPYDRERTTMATFVMCAACRAEYEDPADRRFHAQPIACPACGPQLELRGANGMRIATSDPLAHAVALLRAGRVLAVKGLGGYHLACDAQNETAVQELRQRKQRDAKPFALMVADLAVAQQLCEVSPAESERLRSQERPIVLLRRRPEAQVAASVAPGNPWLGVMLPYTPLHHLLLHDLAGVPLVMTSGNRSDEPIAYDDADAFQRLAGIADAFLTHNRAIHLRCDDSVTRVVAGVELPLRRSRGQAPRALSLPVACPAPVLALGGQWKATFALGRGTHAFLSHHLGDLDHVEAYLAYREAIAHYERLFAIQPALLVHDLHPDYASTRYALERLQASGGRAGPVRLAVQHHHAHLASCMAEHGLEGPVLGVTFDGTGLGTDGTIWGGEFLIGDYQSFRRVAHLRPVPMPGGERAVREPWRMAVAHLADAAIAPRDFFAGRGKSLDLVEQLLARRLNSPFTSSAGRLFDAVAALAGVRQRVTFEGQAAMELEGLATTTEDDGAYPFDLVETAEAPLVIDTRPLIAAVVRDVRSDVLAAVISRRFHAALVEVIVRVCRRLREQSGLDRVVLSGGVFLNALLLGETLARLEGDGFRVYRHRRVPPSDGGLGLGQLAVAAARLSWDNRASQQGVGDVPWSSRPGDRDLS